MFVWHITYLVAWSFLFNRSLRTQLNNQNKIKFFSLRKWVGWWFKQVDEISLHFSESCICISKDRKCVEYSSFFPLSFFLFFFLSLSEILFGGWQVSTLSKIYGNYDLCVRAFACEVSQRIFAIAGIDIFKV